MKIIISALLVALCASLARADDRGFQILAEANLARTQPQQYAALLAQRAPEWRGQEGTRAFDEAVRFLQKARPLAPLAWSDGIGQAALNHALEVGTTGGHGHASANGAMPWDRMAHYGKWQGYAGENIDYGHRSARDIVMTLIVDGGVRGRKHRANLFNKNFGVAGVAVSTHAQWGTVCVMDFATGFVERGQERVAARTGSSSWAFF